MHFRILEMIATSGFLADLECTKFVFGRELTALPTDLLTGLRETLLLKERGGEEMGEGRPLTQIPGSAPGYPHIKSPLGSKVCCIVTSTVESRRMSYDTI